MCHMFLHDLSAGRGPDVKSNVLLSLPASGLAVLLGWGLVSTQHMYVYIYIYVYIERDMTIYAYVCILSRYNIYIYTCK